MEMEIIMTNNPTIEMTEKGEVTVTVGFQAHLNRQKFTELINRIADKKDGTFKATLHTE